MILYFVCIAQNRSNSSPSFTMAMMGLGCLLPGTQDKLKHVKSDRKMKSMASVFHHNVVDSLLVSSISKMKQLHLTGNAPVVPQGDLREIAMPNVNIYSHTFACVKTSPTA
jgi:hypothetical protein